MNKSHLKTVLALGLLLIASAVRAATPEENAQKLKALSEEEDVLTASFSKMTPSPVGDSSNPLRKRLFALIDGLKTQAAAAPTDWSIQNKLGQAYVLGLNVNLPEAFPKAETCFKHAAELAPRHPEPHTNLGYLYMTKESLQKGLAEPEFQLALSLSGDTPDAATYNGLMLASAKLKKWDAAVAAGEKAVSLDPSNNQYRSALNLVRAKRDAEAAKKK